MNIATLLRPQSLDTYFGQNHLVGKNGLIRKIIESDSIFSMILWGPPGSGKTTLAHIISKATNSDFHQISGVTSGKEDLKILLELHVKIINIIKKQFFLLMRFIDGTRLSKMLFCHMLKVDS